jgi:hypothetical protein
MFVTSLLISDRHSQLKKLEAEEEINKQEIEASRGERETDRINNIYLYLNCENRIKHQIFRLCSRFLYILILSLNIY